MRPIVYSDDEYEVVVNKNDTYSVYVRSWENYEMGGNYWVRLGDAPNIDSAMHTINNDRNRKDSVKAT